MCAATSMTIATDQRIVLIAFDCSFEAQSSFCEAFDN
jgi:AraC-like DNA-binding protein